MRTQFNHFPFIKIFTAALIVMMALAALPAKPVGATAYAINEWPSTPTYKGAIIGNPPPQDFTVGAGPDLLLVVAVDLGNSSQEGTSEGLSVAYDGTAMTIAAHQAGTHQSWIFYLPLGTRTSSATGSLAVDIISPHTNVIYWAAVYDHINQANPISGTRNGYINGNGALSYKFPATPVNAGGVGIYTWVSDRSWKNDSEGYTKRGEAYSGEITGGVASKTIPTTGTTGPEVGFDTDYGLNVWLSFVTLNPLASPPPPKVSFDLQAASDTGISNTDNLTKVSSPVFDAIFDKAVTGFEAGDLSNVGSATGCSFAIGSPNGNTYPVTVSGCSEGTLIVRIAAGAVIDSSYDSNAQTDGPTVTLDRTAPAVTFDLQSGSDSGTSTTDNITSSASPIIDASFNDNVNGFTAADLTNVGSATGCSFALGSVSGYTYPITVTGCSGGTLIMNLKAGGITDNAGNGNALTGGLTVTIDRTPPTIVSLILDAASDTGVSNTDNITNKPDLVFDLTYSESVKVVRPDFYGQSGNSNCSYGHTGTMSGNTQTVTFLSCTEGTVKLLVGADTLTDLAGNQMAADKFGPLVTVDKSVPTLSFDLQAASDSGFSNTDNLTNAASLVFDAIFSETVAGFTSGDLVNTGTASGCSFAIGTKSGNTTPFTVSGCSGGTLRVRMAAGGVTDNAGNAIVQTDGPAVTIDRTAPTVTFDLQAASDTGYSSTDDVTRADSLIVDAIFSKTVNGFENGDLSNAGSATGCSMVIGVASGNTFPVTISGCSEGDILLRLADGGVTDNAGNGNAQMDGPTVYIDRTAPVVDEFTATTPSTSLDILIPLFMASDPNGWDVTGFIITESSVAPAADAAGWVVPAPSIYTVSSEGSHSLYPWVQDTGGNVSAVHSPPFTVIVGTTIPAVTAFTATTPVYNSFNIPIPTFTATDAGGVSGYLITESSTPPLVGATGWTVSAPTNYLVLSFGAHTLYPWSKDADGNVSALFSTPRTVEVKFNTDPPTVINFKASTPTNSLNIPIPAFTGLDAIAVFGYMITESATAPSWGVSGFAVNAPTTYTVGSDGTYTLYPWVRNALGQVSAVYGSPQTVVVNQTDLKVSAFSVNPASNSFIIPITAFTAEHIPGTDVNGYLITESASAPAPGAAGWSGHTPSTYTVAADGSYILYPWVRDAAGNVSPIYGSPQTVGVDTAPPQVTVPENKTVEASSASGAIVAFSATATDLADGTLTPTCLPESGSTFGLGTTTAACQATDAAGNTGTNSFTITVQDTTPPEVTVPNNITAEASGPSGAIVTFSVSATDLVDGSLSANCLPASDSTFGLGPTLVTCTATDEAGNPGSNTFTVTVEDTVAPTVTDFAAATRSNTLVIPISTFMAEDTDGVTGYLITESDSPPDAGAPAWSGSAPATYTVNADGSYIFYPWAKDAADNVSAVYDSPRTVEVDTTIAPSATTNAATAVTSTSAILNGKVNASNARTTVNFEYGTTNSYGASSAATPGILTDTTDTSVSLDIGGLTPNTTYHYRVVSVNSGGSTNGLDETFTTLDSMVGIEFHNAAHDLITSAALGNTLHASATVTGTGAVIPTGSIAFTVFQNTTCTGTGAAAGELNLNDNAVADPSQDVAMTPNGLSFKAHYGGDLSYPAGDSPCTAITTSPYLTVLVLSASTHPKDGDVLTKGISNITIQFSKDVLADNRTSEHSALNPLNYLLLNPGVNGIFDTSACGPSGVGGLKPDDQQITVDSIIYSPTTFVATLNINHGVALVGGTYKLFICGTTSITDPAQNAFLNNHESDSILNFQIATKRTHLPDTGFAPDMFTILPFQPVEKAYTTYGDLTMEIPSLGLKTAIIGVPKTENGWDVTWLGSKAGWLNGTAFPTWNGNSVITGHVWDANNQPGIFINLKQLKYGDQVKIHSWGQVYTFEVRQNQTVNPESVETALKHEDKSWITLLTCEDFNLRLHSYASRRVVRAVLLSVTAEK